MALLEAFHMADHFVDRAETKLGHDFADLLGDAVKEGHDVFRAALELAAGPLVEGDKSLAQITQDVCAPLERRATWLWWSAFALSSSMLLLGVAAVSYQIATGIGCT